MLWPKFTESPSPEGTVLTLTIHDERSMGNIWVTYPIPERFLTIVRATLLDLQMALNYRGTLPEAEAKIRDV